MALVLTPYKTTNVSYYPLVGGKPAWKLDIPANAIDDLLDYLQLNCGTGNGTVTHTGSLTSTALVTGNGSADLQTPYASLTVSSAGLMTFGGTAKIAQNSWTTVTLQHGWSNGSPVPAYMIDAMQFVHLRGYISGGTTTDGTVVFTLPSGFRPPATVELVILNAAGGGTFGRLLISSSGDCAIYGMSGVTLIALSGSFSAA